LFIYIICVIGTAAHQVAQLAPTLKEAELRVLLHLAATADATGSTTIVASSRDLEVAVRVARRAIQRATDALAERGLIATRQGTPRSPATYLLRFVEVAQMPAGGGVFRTPPPPVENSGQVALFERLRGVEGTPPPTANQQLTASAAAVDPEGVLTLESIIDRLHRATQKSVDPKTLTQARGALQSYRAKRGSPPNWGGPLPPHPPDDRITAQFLSMGDGVGGWPRLSNMLLDLHAESKEPGHSYAWFVTIAAQRLHGIDPRMLAQRRKQLKLVRDGHRAEINQLRSAPELLAEMRKLR
jgi:hypothetical protein